MAGGHSQHGAYRSLGWPIGLGVSLLVLLALLIAFWLIFPFVTGSPALYWTLLIIGLLFLVLVVVGVSLYLALTVKAVRLTQRQSNFIDSVTHELKSPIASLKLYLQTLSRHDVGPERRTDFYRFMLKDIERLDRLITQLLAAAQLERGATAEELELVAVPEILNECVEAARRQYDLPDDAIRLVFEDAVVRARRVDIGVIFRNLIDNAIKYCGDPPEVAIECRKRGEWAIVRISDNGPGIEPANRRKVFGRFVRLGQELERDKPGTGLGLYIVRTLVMQLRGRISVRNRVLGNGCVFEVMLRIHHPPNKPANPRILGEPTGAETT